MILFKISNGEDNKIDIAKLFLEPEPQVKVKDNVIKVSFTNRDVTKSSSKIHGKSERLF